MLQSLLRIESRLNQQFQTRTEGQSSVERTSVAATQPVADITTANISSEETRYDFILSSASVSLKPILFESQQRMMIT